MTDPVDTDALRNPSWSNLDAVGTLLEAAADEVDRLRTAIADADDRLALGVLVNLDGEQFVDHPVMQMLAEKNERLRAVIENAPHTQDCVWKTNAARIGGMNQGCTCWKADAL